MNSKNSGYLKSMKLDADERGYNLKIRVHPPHPRSSASNFLRFSNIELL